MKNKNLMYILIGSVVVIGIVILVLVLMKKKTTSTTSTGTSTTPTECTKYTSAMQTRDLSQIRSKCYPKFLIPIVGVGYYNNCVSEGKATLPYIGDCI